jgi:RNA polymerase sigma-70 factor (ECF subfamily)
VFLQALPRLHTLRDVKRFGAWLAAIARNRANDYHRHTVEEIELSEDSEQEQEHLRTGRNSLDGKDAETAFVLAAIRALPETYRETLLLRLVEGMTGPEIASRTGLTPGSVRVNLHRGMQQLREKLGRGNRRDRV